MNVGAGRIDPHPDWKVLWGRSVPPKVNVFNWRVLHRIVPCYYTLSDRHLSTPVVCPVCCKDPEDLHHMLFTCDRAKIVWRELGLGTTIETAAAHERSGSVILEKLWCTKLPGEIKLPNDNGVETVIVTGWYLWWDRRKISHHENVGIPFRSAMSIRGIVANSLATKANVPTREIRWSRPANRVIKLNVDASYHVDAGAGATGAVLRDSSGAFIAATCSFK